MLGSSTTQQLLDAITTLRIADQPEYVGLTWRE
jgi:hypothetical protein